MDIIHEAFKPPEPWVNDKLCETSRPLQGAMN
ncbi:hypothetical protein RCH06_003257 [Polaromonas sp. CG_9.5]|nr:hypothetical protein [Polaromonas sp. CG_9.5]